MRSVISFLGLVVMFASCTHPEYATREELNAYILKEENGLQKKTESNGIQLEIRVYPTDLILAEEIDGKNYKPSQVDSIHNKLQDIQYFRFSISRDDQEVVNALALDEDQFKRGLEYLSSGIGEDLKLIQDLDTTDVQGVMYLRGYGISRASVLLVAFKRKLTHDDPVTVMYNDSFFNTGLTRFDFRLNDLNSIPTLIL